ncbi:WD40-repeat-containing domain protein [Blastocladiella britannica]|nr:WD40-repeat-containing domain protein [Blastocladiella britannica]
MSILTTKQGDELRRAVLDYLVAANLPESAAAFSRESHLDTDATATSTATAPPGPTLLEKKWTSVVRLQRKIMDLESQVAALTAEVASSTHGSGSGRGSNGTNGRGGGHNGAVVPRAPALREMLSHRAPVVCVATHPVYPVALSGSDDASAKVWDIESGEFERSLRGHTKPVNGVAVDPHGGLAATCSSDLSIKLWDVAADYANVKTLHGHDHSVSSVCFLPGAPIPGAEPTAVGPSARAPATHLVSASRDKSIKVWDLSNGYCTKTLTGHADWVRAVAAADDGRLVVSGSSDQTARIWNAQTGECVTELRGHDHVVEAVAFVPIAAYPAIRELLVAQAAAAAAGNGNGAPLPPAAMPTHAGAYVLTGSRDKEIRLWDTATGLSLFVFRGHDNWIRGICVPQVPDARHFISVSDDKSIKVWDLSSGRCVKTLNDAHGHFVTSIAWAPATASLVTGSVDMSVKVWESK